MKKLLVLFVLLFLSMPALAEEPILGAADHISTEGEAALQEILPDFSFRDTVRSLSAGNDNSFLQRLWQGIARFAFGEVQNNLSVPLTVTAVAVLCSILGNLNSGGTAEVGFFLVYTASIGLAAAAVGDTADLARRFAEDMTTFTSVAMPSLSVLSLESGLGAAAMHPMLLAASAASSLLLTKVGIPALYISLALSIVAGLSGRTMLRSLSAFVRKSALWAVCGSLTVFGAVISISGFAAGTLGGIAAKGIRYAVSSLVPVLGGLLSESVEAVTQSAQAIKNAAGTAGMLFLFLLTAYPVIKIAIQSLLYRLASALSETSADKRIAASLSDIADMLSALCGMTAAAGVLAVLSMGMLLRIGSAGVVAP